MDPFISMVTWVTQDYATAQISAGFENSKWWATTVIQQAQWFSFKVICSSSYPIHFLFLKTGNVKKSMFKILRGKHTVTFRQRSELSLGSQSFGCHESQCCSLLGWASSQHGHAALWGILWGWGMTVSLSPNWLFNQEHTSLFAIASDSFFKIKILLHHWGRFWSTKESTSSLAKLCRLAGFSILISLVLTLVLLRLQKVWV